MANHHHWFPHVLFVQMFPDPDFISRSTITKASIPPKDAKINKRDHFVFSSGHSIHLGVVWLFPWPHCSHCFAFLIISLFIASHQMHYRAILFITSIQMCPSCRCSNVLDLMDFGKTNRCPHYIRLSSTVNSWNLAKLGLSCSLHLFVTTLYNVLVSEPCILGFPSCLVVMERLSLAQHEHRSIFLEVLGTVLWQSVHNCNFRAFLMNGVIITVEKSFHTLHT